MTGNGIARLKRRRAAIQNEIDRLTSIVSEAAEDLDLYARELEDVNSRIAFAEFDARTRPVTFTAIEEAVPA